MNGLVLAGGKSSRMGEDKAGLNYHNCPQYQYLYNLLIKYCEEVWISSNEKIYDIPTMKDNVVYTDIGPIAGILTAMEYQRTDWLIIAVDYPLITSAEIAQLIRSNHSLGASFHNPQSNYYEPYLAIYRAAFYDKIKSAYACGEISLQSILNKHNVEKITPINLDFIRSIDTIEAMEQIKNKYF